MPRSKSLDQPRPVLETGEQDVMSLDEFPIEARLRYVNAENWVAWAPDGKSVIAADKDLDVVIEAARRAGFSSPLYEWVLPVTGPIWK